MQILKKYYFTYLIIFSILFFPLSLVGESVNSFYEDLIFGQTVAIFTTIIIGTLYFFWDTKWGPKKRIRLLSKSPFLEFKKIGFKEVNNELIGFYKNYQVKISYNWIGKQSQSCIELVIYFNPKLKDEFITIDEIIEIYHELDIRNYYCFDVISKEWSFNLFPPNFKKIYEFLDLIIKSLTSRSILPISIEEYKKINLEYLEFTKKYIKQKKTK